MDELVPLLAGADTVYALLERELQRTNTEALAAVLIGDLFDAHRLRIALERYREREVDTAQLHEIRDKLARLARAERRPTPRALGRELDAEARDLADRP